MTVRSMQETEARYGQVTDRVAELMGVINAAHGELVSVLAEAVDERVWDVWGIHSPGHWVSWQTGCTLSRGHAIAKLAERRGELPTAVAALQAGSLSLDAAVQIARRGPAAYEHDITEFARQATISQLQSSLRDYVYDDDTEKTKPKARQDTRGVSKGEDDTGWWAKLRLDPDEGAVVDRSLQATYEDLQRQARAETPEGQTPPRVTMADALVAVAEAALRAGEAAFPGSDRYLVHLHLDAHPTNTDGDDPELALSFHLSGPVSAALRGLLLCGDIALRPTFWDQGTPLSVGRKTRTVNRRLKRAIEHRDSGCRVPGCGRRSSLDIHHITHWEHGGPTNTNNLICLCRRHHRLHHLGHLAISGNPNHPAPGCGNPKPAMTGPTGCNTTSSGRASSADAADPPDSAGPSLAPDKGPMRFTDRWGRLIEPAGTPTTPDADLDAAAAAVAAGVEPTDDYEHPLGERLQHWGVHFNPNHPPPNPPPPKDHDLGDDDTGNDTAGSPSPSDGTVTNTDGRRPGSGPTPGPNPHGTGPPDDPRHGGPPTATGPPAA